jgi:geranylgeranyl diphosphate synthase, type II
MSNDIRGMLQDIEREIAAINLPSRPAGLYEPVLYCLKNGGKRIRPLMTLLACELFEGDRQKAIPPAVGLELFHNFTLMHDDIMDNAPIRRGQPSVHNKWDANTAILSGDALFSLACQFVGRVPDHCLREINELFHKTVIEVCEGQQYDMNFESSEQVTEEEYLEMIRLKTAVLPAACLKTGAIVASAPAEDANHLYSFGESIGLAFQLKDDWLDVFGDEAVFGKKSGGDIVANKKTWLYIKALELADEVQKNVLQLAYSNRISNKEEKVSQVKKVFKELQLHQLALQQMEVFHSSAMDHLVQINVPEHNKSNLKQMAADLLNRKH